MNNFRLSDIDKEKPVHFVGIGGISMSGLAKILLKKGYKVTGSDMAESETVKMLKNAGIDVKIGHRKENIENAGLVVYTAAVKKDNQELKAASEKNIKAIERSVLLGAVMHDFDNGIGIAGTHGKTTTTSMMSHVLLCAGADPTITLGGQLDIIGGNVRLGESEYFLTEACEYHCSFLEFFPTIAVVTNVDADHLDYFKNMDNIKKAFTDYLAIPDENGFAVVCGDDENAMECTKNVRGELLTYGMSESCTFCAQNLSFDKDGCGIFDVEYDGKIINVHLNVSGKHNVLNALACFAVGYALGFDGETVKEGVSQFKMVHRRFEKKGYVNGALVIDDYAHHPTEIKCTLDTARNITKGKLYVCFQPHTYTRTYLLFDEFKTAFNAADEILFLDIYAAREKDTGLVNSRQLAQAVCGEGKKAIYEPGFDAAAEYIRKNAKEGDTVICMGAGSVYKIAQDIVR